MSVRAHRVVLACACAALLASASGCGRRPHVEYPAGDSLSTARLDSTVILTRQAQQAWDAPGGGEAAARASARALGLALAAAAPEDWTARAQVFLDSLGVGMELAGGRCALAVNFFSRADPAAGSWPYLFWCGPRGPESQPLEGRSMRLLQLASRGLRADGARDSVPPAVALLLDRRAPVGSQLYLVVWTRNPQGWEVAQTLGPDSLGGAGTGDFETRGDTLMLVTRTYRTNRGFEECTTCPHIYRVRRLAWGRDGFVVQSEEESPSPYSTFVRFIQALVTNDRTTAEALVSDRSLVEVARREGFAQSRGLWRVAPATDETATHMVFLRGAGEAYDLQFALTGGEWLVSGIQPTDHKVE